MAVDSPDGKNYSFYSPSSLIKRTFVSSDLTTLGNVEEMTGNDWR